MSRLSQLPVIESVTQNCPPGFQPGLPLPEEEQGFSRGSCGQTEGKRSNCSEKLRGTAAGDSPGQGGDCPADGAKLGIIALPGPGGALGRTERPQNSSLKVKPSPGKRWGGAQPRQRHVPAPQHPAASPALWLRALGFSSSGKK